jgi:hypothetical protein
MKNHNQEVKPETTARTEMVAVTEPPKAAHWGQSAFIVLFACCMAFVILTPHDVLQRYPEVVPYVDWMASWNLHVHRLGLKHISGPLADANRFCAAVMWGVWTPIWVISFAYFFWKTRYKKTEITTKMILFGLFVAPVLAYLVLYATGDLNSSKGRFMAINTLGRSIFIPGVIGLFWISVAMAISTWSDTLRGNFSV